MTLSERVAVEDITPFSNVAAHGSRWRCVMFALPDGYAETSVSTSMTRRIVAVSFADAVRPS